jgi:nicotinate-nucleotide adenylyltransferase
VSLAARTLVIAIAVLISGSAESRPMDGGLLGAARRLLHAAPAPGGVAIFTGTFDPIHDGHIRAAESALAATGVERVILVPRAPYGEKHPVAMATRLQMMRLAVEGHPGIEVADMATVTRLSRDGDEALVRELARRGRGAPVVRVYGADSFATILGNGLLRRSMGTAVKIAVVPRAGTVLPARLPPGVTLLPATRKALSSTAIRAALARGRAPAGLSPAVARYIHEHRLYGAR